MTVNSITSTQMVQTYSSYESKSSTSSAASSSASDYAASAGVVYEKSEESTSKSATYSINKMSSEDRAALVEQLKADQENRQQSLMSLVQSTFTGQASSFSLTVNSDDVWKLFADGNFTVDAAAKKQAQEDISENGYWGVTQTSQRLFDFASALAGDDVETMQAMQKAMEKGFKQATKSWGKELPQISQDTKAAADKLFEDYYKSKETTSVS
jgi:anti-sigma28 factor (negative regulator of flagellin synthesis)